MGAGLKVGDVMTKHVVSLQEDASVHQAACLMLKHNISSIVVLRGRQVKGMITEGDIVRKVVAEGKDAENTPVHIIMSTPVQVISCDVDIVDAAKMMRKNNIKRLPVINEKEEVVGIITETDIVRLLPSLIDLIEEKIIVEGI
jgi:CBS domain-containing protein